MPDTDERTRIELQLAAYREIALAVSDVETAEYIKGRIAALELQLRHMPAAKST